MKKLTIEELNRCTVEEFQQAEKLPVVVVLDNVRSLYNIGSVFRTADAFRIKEIILCGITATPPHVEIHKTALGAENSVKWRYFNDTLEAVAQLKKENYEIWAVEQVENSQSLQNFNFSKDKKYAVILGHEVKGVQQEVVNECKGAIEIPQFGTKHSLNVSVASGLVMWEALKKIYYLLFIIFYFNFTPLSAQKILDIDGDTTQIAALQLDLQVGRVKYKNDSIPHVILPTLNKYSPLTFKNDKEQQRYTRLVRNVKKCLPLAKLVRYTIIETYDYLKTLPTKEAKAEHIKAVEAGLKKQYYPILKRMTKSQGRLLVKLVDRECAQTGYSIAKAFVGTFKANFYQGIAWLFGQSLNKTYDPEGEDAEIERIARMVESGQI